MFLPSFDITLSNKNSLSLSLSAGTEAPHRYLERDVGLYNRLHELP